MRVIQFLLFLIFFGFFAAYVNAANLYPMRDRFGIGFDQHKIGNGIDRKIDEFESAVMEIKPGWYFDWGYRGGDRTWIKYFRLVGYSSFSQSLCDENKNEPNGSVFMVGNESGFDDLKNPEEYAVHYNKWYKCLKALNPTFKVSPGAMMSTQRTYCEPWNHSAENPPDKNPCTGKKLSNLEWYREMVTIYKEKFGDFPLDLWVTHIYPFNWNKNNPYEMNFEGFKKELIAQRQFMKDMGWQNKELVISEWGLLNPDDVESEKTYKEKTLEYLINTQNTCAGAQETNCDLNLGNPNDNFRLASRWAPFVFNDWPVQGGSAKPGMSMVDTYNPNNILPLGKQYKDFIRRYYVGGYKQLSSLINKYAQSTSVGMRYMLWRRSMLGKD